MSLSPNCRAELDEERGLPWICRCADCNRIRNQWKRSRAESDEIPSPDEPQEREAEEEKDGR